MKAETTLTSYATPLSPVIGIEEQPTGLLAQEYASWQNLFQAQAAMVQHYLLGQGLALAEMLLQNRNTVRFALPERVLIGGAGKETPVPPGLRDQIVRQTIFRIKRENIYWAVCLRLDELEAAANPAAATAAGLLRYITAVTMVHDLLPAGRKVRYQYGPGDDVPTLPVNDGHQTAPAVVSDRDAIVGDRSGHADMEREQLTVPYVAAARHFYLPQWVALGADDQLLVSSIAEAEAQVASMQGYVNVLDIAIHLAPYLAADEQYQQKRYGILGQLTNQGRALARCETREMIEIIRQRAAANSLNRGLRLSLPYFDDQAMKMMSLDFTVIPFGRVMFVPAFVVLAVRKERAKVDQDRRLNRSTRNHLLDELNMLEKAFKLPRS